MKNSNIEWTTHTFNPWEGCTKVSPGCAHCYAEARNARFGGGTAPNWGPGAPRRRTSAQNWTQPRLWNRQPSGLSVASRPRVFCASLADWLDDAVEAHWLSDLLCLIRSTPNLDWLLLTKRPQLFRRRLQAVAALGDLGGQIAAEWLAGRPLPSLWIGVTVEDQIRAVERIPLLLTIPARIRFLSCEPLLGPVDLLPLRLPDSAGRAAGDAGLHWIICGGESGRAARPMPPAWARSLRDQGAAHEIAFHFKQWGEWLPACQYEAGDRERLHEKAQHTFSPDEHSFLVGKLAAGRRLDGRTHDGIPTPNVPGQP